MERISIELTDYCFKGCSFCYNGSNAKGRKFWLESELVDFVQDCAANGLKAVSFGGGEPLQHPDIFSILTKLQGKLFRSLTTNGLLLEQNLSQLVAAKPDKVHVSIHFPDDQVEVVRVIEQVHQLQSAGIRSGINLLVARSWLVVFENVSFKETKWLQPALRVPCEMWMEGEYHCIDEQGNAVKVPEQFCPPKDFFGSRLPVQHLLLPLLLPLLLLQTRPLRRSPPHGGRSFLASNKVSLA